MGRDAVLRGEPERRRIRRVGRGNLDVTVRPTGHRGWISRPRIANWMDFNRFGICFVCDKAYGLGRRLRLELRLDAERSVLLPKVCGVVRFIARENAQLYRHGIEFDFHMYSQRNSERIRAGLEEIERVLGRILDSAGRDR